MTVAGGGFDPLPLRKELQDMYELRDYQREAVDAAVAFFNRGECGNGVRALQTGRNGVMVLPTGAGKSLVIANIALRLDAPLLIFQPSKEILEQNYDKLLSYGFHEAGIFSASMGRKDVRTVTFATIGSVKGHTDIFRAFRYVIVDECHCVNAAEGMYKTFLGALRCRVIGLTATPYRLYSSPFYGSMLRFITRTRPRIFSEVLYCCQVGELLRRGYLAKQEYYQLGIVDTSKLAVNSTGADYTDESVRKHYAAIHYTERLTDVVRRLLAVGRSSILVFTRFVDEARGVAEALGERAAVVSGGTPKAERERVLRDFKAGRIKAVANVGVLTTGFDFPGLETVVLGRPTMSLALYYQMVGRGIRPCEGKKAWVVDLCGNTQRFGRVEDLVVRETKPGLHAVFSGERQLTNVFFGR